MSENKSSETRRDFLKQAGLMAATGVLAGTAVPKVHAAENNTIRIALIGCGGRGRGAVVDAIQTSGPTRVVALADAFDEKAKSIGDFMQSQFPGKIDLGDRMFGGLDSYKKAMDCLNPGDFVILAAPPAFRWLHFEYAVEKGLHVFAEKALAVDAPSCRKMLEINKKALEKKLKVGVGLNNRHYPKTGDAVARIQDGAIGDIISCWVYRLQPEYANVPTPGKTEFQHQLLNFNGFTWVSGSYMVDWMIHNLDICCWARKDSWPVSVQGQGGRQVRRFNDQMYDHCAYEYRFADGVKMMTQLRQIPNTWRSFRAVIQGTKGSAVLGEGVREPLFYKGFKQVKDEIVWKSEMPSGSSYQIEHDGLFDAIRNDKPWNEVERGVQATMVAIMGRMAVDSGREVEAKDAWNSQYDLCPGIENWTLDSAAPIRANADGSYNLATPGVTKEY